MRRTPNLPHAHALRATLAGDGSPSPIEMRVGRRLLRVLPPDSDEARALLQSGAVDLVGPGGEKFGKVRVAEAWRVLGEQLEDRLDESGSSPVDEWVRASLARLRALEASLEPVESPQLD